MKTPHADVALAIGRSLVRDAIWSGPYCTWVGSTVEIDHGQPAVTLRSLGADVYGGTSGVALFLASLTRHSDEPAIAQAARAALATAALLADSLPPWSFYAGRLGVACALIECGELLDDVDLMLQGLEMLRQEPPPLDGAPLDALSGIAGCIAPLLRLYFRHGDDHLLARAVACGNRLVATAERAGEHASCDDLADRNLTGYSHGAAGIALSLLQLADALGRRGGNRLESFGGVAHRQGARVGRGCRSGAGGRASDVDDRTHAFSLCHALAGVGDLFLTASEQLDARYLSFAEWIAGRGAELHHHDGRCPSGLAGGADTPGLSSAAPASATSICEWPRRSRRRRFSASRRRMSDPPLLHASTACGHGEADGRKNLSRSLHTVFMVRSSPSNAIRRARFPSSARLTFIQRMR